MAEPKVEDKVIEAIEMAEQEPDNLIRLSSGVVLRGKQANPMVLIDVMAQFKRPEPPTYFNDKMGRAMVNPDDPDYRARVSAYELELSSAMLPMMILSGTELGSVPKGFPKPEDDEWLEEYELLNLPMKRENKHWRYLKWVMFKAMRNEKDMALVQEVVGRLSGISESAVKSAERFPGSE